MATEQDQNKQLPLPASLEQAAKDWLEHTYPHLLLSDRFLFIETFKAGGNHILNSIPQTTVYVATPIEQKPQYTGWFNFITTDGSPTECGRMFYSDNKQEWDWLSSDTLRAYRDHAATLFYLNPFSIPDIIGEKDKEIAELKKQLEENDLDSFLLLRDKILPDYIKTIKQKEQEIERLKNENISLQVKRDQVQVAYDNLLEITKYI